MDFEEIQKNKIGESEFLWRFLDLHKFISLIKDKCLFFNQLSNFEDLYEGLSMKYLKQEDVRTNLFEGKSDEELKKMKGYHPIIHDVIGVQDNGSRTREREQKSQYASCWFRHERESIAMWNLYSNNNSVAIKIGGRRLVDLLRKEIEKPEYSGISDKFVSGAVEYLKLNPIDLNEKSSSKYNGFKKEIAFEYEKEYRFLIASEILEVGNYPSFKTIKLKEDFFESIVIITHPKMDNWKFKNIEFICETFKLSNLKKSSIKLR